MHLKLWGKCVNILSEQWICYVAQNRQNVHRPKDRNTLLLFHYRKSNTIQGKTHPQGPSKLTWGFLKITIMINGRVSREDFNSLLNVSLHSFRLPTVVFLLEPT